MAQRRRQQSIDGDVEIGERCYVAESAAVFPERLRLGDGSAGPGPEPGLQGTEMWLAVIWLLADLLGRSGELGYRPRGIHRPDPFRPAVPFDRDMPEPDRGARAAAGSVHRPATGAEE
ncbi:hypothetical protein [Streptomyces sp. ALI-76-A]|uniref:hypothetical protein n=1 Tax=Streptomyces sp. ALI-76-A TaxID=3025736 RepID=UPI00256ECD8C|nr:hypothetical protein [Streptomyces sp. ALI-76-A]MDL5200015.1 hypothetical protein [Streptomyces sp. ALI-76-A]